MTPRVERGLEEHRYEDGEYGGYGMPRGPLGFADIGPLPAPAIGFCPKCGENARATTAIRGVYDCPWCTYFWYDKRVGEQTREIEDYFVPVDGD